MAGALVTTGTLFYWRFEEWTIIESLYFWFATLHFSASEFSVRPPPGTQIFTIIYILTGFGILVALLTSVAQEYLKLKAEDSGRPGDRLRARRERRKGPAVERGTAVARIGREILFRRLWRGQATSSGCVLN